MLPAVELTFARASGDRTWLARQRAAYPFHVGRTLAVSGDPSELTSVYLQCCSGGLFENDDVHLRIETQPGALAHVGTAAATIVHSMNGTQARQRVDLIARSQSTLEYLPDSVILFPNAHLAAELHIELDEDARLLVAETVLAHDPDGAQRSFQRYESVVNVRCASGRLLARDRWRMDGSVFTQGLAAVTGVHRAQATLMILHRRGDIEQLLTATRAVLPPDATLYCGASRLPNDCGVLVRALSLDERGVRALIRSVRDAVRALWFPGSEAAAQASAGAYAPAEG